MISVYDIAFCTNGMVIWSTLSGMTSLFCVWSIYQMWRDYIPEVTEGFTGVFLPLVLVCLMTPGILMYDCCTEADDVSYQKVARLNKTIPESKIYTKQLMSDGYLSRRDCQMICYKSRKYPVKQSRLKVLKGLSNDN